MELLLNLIWVTISLTALSAWISRREPSGSHVTPGTLRGLMVIVCILALLFPAISISDDLSQTISLAEGSRLQDVLKAPELRGVYHLAPAVPEILASFQIESPAAGRSGFCAEVSIILHETLRTPSVEKRPPPQPV